MISLKPLSVFENKKKSEDKHNSDKVYLSDWIRLKEYCHLQRFIHPFAYFRMGVSQSGHSGVSPVQNIQQH
eukprot:3208303-Amphidinium_carterae.2